MKLFIVGKANDRYNDWEFCGVFDDEKKAVEVCTTSNHFVGPCVLNKKIPDERTEWPESYYPRSTNL